MFWVNELKNNYALWIFNFTTGTVSYSDFGKFQKNRPQLAPVQELSFEFINVTMLYKFTGWPNSCAKGMYFGNDISLQNAP